MNSICPRCSFVITGPFPIQCPNCGFNVSELAGMGTSSFQVRKWNEHTDIIQDRNIDLYGKQYNASFDYNGTAMLQDLVRFTISYGDRISLPSSRGYTEQYIIAYIPEPIGAGTAIHFPRAVPCSGICLISPSSPRYAHPIPVIDEWATRKFARFSSTCRFCGAPASVGQIVCPNCYIPYAGDWRTLL